ncbi:MAG: phage terminase large subunit [Bacteroidota bacterium]
MKRIDFKPSERQYKLWCVLEDGVHELILAGGAAGGGKSYLGSAWLIIQSMRYDDTRWVVGRKTLKNLKESTLNTILSLLKKWEIPYNYNQINLDITFDNGSKIILKEFATTPSDPNYERFGSSEYTGAFIDEVSEIAERAVEVLRSRIRWKVAEYGLIPKLLMSTNPTINWVRSRFVQDDEGNPIDLPPDEAYIPFNVYDNPDEAFKKVYISNLERLRDTEMRERLFYGNWNYVTSNEAAFYSGFDGGSHLVTGLKSKYYDRNKPLHIAFDFNVYPYLSSLVAQVDSKNKKIYIFEEVLGRPPKSNKTAATAEAIVMRFLSHKGGVFIYGDPSGRKEDTRSLQGHNDFHIVLRVFGGKLGGRAQLRVSRAAPPVKLRGDWINEIFAENLDGWKILIDMKCRKLTEDLLYGLSDEDGGKDKSKVKDDKTGVRYEKHHHLSDAMDYFLCEVLKYSWYKFKKGGRAGTTVSTSFVRHNSHSY